MTYLLDTHVLIWWNSAPERIGPAALAVLGDPRNTIVVSVVSIWEIAIKQALGRLSLSRSATSAAEAYGFALLPIEAADAEAAGALPLHHGDPFDRMLVAQADRRGIVLVTADRVLAVYGVAMLSAR